MPDDRTHAFIAAARNMRAPADAAIEHTVFSGGGVRLKGFSSVSGRRLKHLLQAYGKRAVIYVNTATNDSIYIDCYDDIEPVQLTVCTPDGMVPQPTKDGAPYQYGAVQYSRYTCDTLTSENLKRLFLGASVLDCKIRVNGFTLQTIVAASTKIVGGLRSQAATANLTRDTTPGSRIFFKRGAAKLKHAKQPKKGIGFQRMRFWGSGTTT